MPLNPFKQKCRNTSITGLNWAGSLTPIRETLEDAYGSALRQAALEAFEGRYEAMDLGPMVERKALIEQAIALIREPESD